MGNQPKPMDKGGATLLNNTEENRKKKVVAVIVSLSSNGSYDNLFTTVEQKSEEGTRVLTYSCSHQYIVNLIRIF